jgi:hypothetical protein
MERERKAQTLAALSGEKWPLQKRFWTVCPWVRPPVRFVRLSP